MAGSWVRAGGVQRLYRSDNATYNEISYAATDKFQFNQANGGTYNWAISGVDKLSLLASGDLKALSGNFVPSTSGKGIDFSAVTPTAGMTSQLLANYEEGTWTPTDGSGAGLILTVTSASYTRTGRTVFLTGDITYPVTASASAAILSGLPFNSASNGGGMNVHYTGYASRFSGVTGGASIILYGLTGSGSTAMTNVSLSTIRMIFTVSYRI
jgi:hypothetical protein